MSHRLLHRKIARVATKLGGGMSLSEVAETERMSVPQMRAFASRYGMKSLIGSPYKTGFPVIITKQARERLEAYAISRQWEIADLSAALLQACSETHDLIRNVLDDAA